VVKVSTELQGVGYELTRGHPGQSGNFEFRQRDFQGCVDRLQSSVPAAPSNVAPVVVEETAKHVSETTSPASPTSSVAVPVGGEEARSSTAGALPVPEHLAEMQERQIDLHDMHDAKVRSPTGTEVTVKAFDPKASPGPALTVQTSSTDERRPFVSSSASTNGSFTERVWLYSHRSCSSDFEAECSEQFRKQEQATEKMALEMGLLQSHIFCYWNLPEYLLKDPRWGERYTAPHLRGRGYWFWKAAILDHMVADISMGIHEGDWIIFVDGDRPWFMHKLFEIAQRFDHDSKPDVVVQHQPGQEQAYSRGDVFGRFGVEPTNGHYGMTWQYKAQVFALRVNARTRKFAKSWVDLAADFHLISGEESRNTPDAKKFKKSREDQSLYSMLVKASLPGGCKEVSLPGFQASPGSDDATCIHPEFGIPGLTIFVERFR